MEDGRDYNTVVLSDSCVVLVEWKGPKGMVKSKSDIRSFIPLTQSESLFHTKLKVKPEQQQRILGSFAQMWF